MSIYTRAGDAGETGLADGTRDSKASVRIEALGALDELGSVLGIVRQAVEDPPLYETLLFIQQRVFNCSAALANPAPNATTPGISDDDVAFLETAIDFLDPGAGQWRGFVLASGGEAAARLHLARTVARRAERRVVALGSQTDLPANVLPFLNRLSDVLFAAARTAAIDADTPEDTWDTNAAPPALGPSDKLQSNSTQS